ncbi:MAG: hypothetical protein WC364_12900 [Eubacteriales bacterium]|jgi:hypothetical protein
MRIKVVIITVKNDYRIRGDHAIVYVKTSRDKKLLFVIIDAEDIEKVKSISGFWYAYKAKNQSYYIFGRINGKPVALYRHILDYHTSGMKNHVDHINNNTLDNRKCNLRIISASGNQQNRKGAQRGNISGLRGVSWNKFSKTWDVRVQVSGKKVYRKRTDSKRKAERMATRAREIYMPYSKEAAKK